MVLGYVLFSSMLTAFANLIVRKSIDLKNQGSGDPFLVYRLMGAGLVVGTFALLNGGLNFNLLMISLGMIGGFFLSMLMWTIGRSVEKGPPALSFTCVAASAVFPPLFMALLFGEPFGHSYTLKNGLGMALVLAGLVWMGLEQWKKSERSPDTIKWLFWTLCAFGVNALYYILFQWRALMLKDDLPASALLPWHCDPANGDCFIIIMYITAACCQFFIPGKALANDFPVKHRILYGCLGGIINGISGFILIKATEMATVDAEKAIIFPLFCVGLIFSCNLWGKALYKEKVNWFANAACLVGIFIGV